jgi:hypothetical protein
MTSKPFFLKEIRKENYRRSLSSDDQTSLDKYLSEMKQGPGDSEMDIAWMEEGRAYYAHQHYLDSIKNEQERELYLSRLRDDIETWLSEDPNNYTVGRVRDLFDDN